MKLKTKIFVDEINEYAEKGKWFWVACCAKDFGKILIRVLDNLHPVAKIAVEHYWEERKNE